MPRDDLVLLADIRCFICFSSFFFLIVDFKWVQQKMKEQHEEELQELEVSSLVLICSVVLSTDVCVCN